jgi:hypothetical protein
VHCFSCTTRISDGDCIPATNFGSISPHVTSSRSTWIVQESCPFAYCAPILGLRSIAWDMFIRGLRFAEASGISVMSHPKMNMAFPIDQERKAYLAELSGDFLRLLLHRQCAVTKLQDKVYAFLCLLSESDLSVDIRYEDPVYVVTEKRRSK